MTQRCPNCGSSDIEILKDKGRCKHCGTPFIPTKIEITNITNIQNNHKMREDKYQIRINYDENVFFKKAMIFLATNKNIGKNIYNASFQKPELFYDYISVVDCECKIDYNLELGVEEKVRKKVEEPFYDRRSKKYRTHYVDKVVTETRWEPYSGHYNDLRREVSFYNDLPSSLKKLIERFANNIPVGDIARTTKQEDYPEISVAELDRISNVAVQNSAKSYKNHIASGNYRNLSIPSGTAHIDHLETYKLPIYRLPFILDGKSYNLYGLADDYFLIAVDDIVDKEKTNLIDDLTQKSERVKKPLKISLLLSTIAFSIVSIILMIALANKTSIAIICIWFAINIIGFIIYKSIISKSKKTLDSNIETYHENLYIEKKSLCMSYFIARGISQPTEAEFNEYEQEMKKYER